jgi:5'-nucleotidase
MLGNYVCDLMRNDTRSEIALLNGGSFRSEKVFGPGEIKLKDLMSIFPFPNTVVVFKANGSQVTS